MMLADGHNGPVMLARPTTRNRKVLEDGNAIKHYHGVHLGINVPRTVVDFARDLGKPTLVDPMTYVFVIEPERLKNRKTGEVPKWIASAAGTYGLPLGISTDYKPLRPAGLLGSDAVRAAFTEKVLAHQDKLFEGQMSLFGTQYDKYAQWSEEQGEKTQVPASAASPAVLIPPYFYFRRPDDEWYKAAWACAGDALRHRHRGQLIYPVLHFARQRLSEKANIDRVAGEYAGGGFDGFFLWPNDFREEKEPLDRCLGLVRLVRSLTESGKPVFKLYGGFFSMLLFEHGLKGFSCGMGSGTYKNAFATGGSRRKPESQFYVPALHRSLAMTDAERLLKAYPALRCGCRACRGTYGDDVSKFGHMGRRGLCESHFLNARRDELKACAEGGVPRLLRTIKGTAGEFASNALVDVRALETWRRAVEEGS